MNFKGFLDLAWQSVKDSFTGVIWKYLLGGSGSLVAILLIGKNFFGTTVKISVIIGSGLLLLLFLIRSFLFFGRNSFKYLHKLYRDSKYGEAIILLKEAFSRIHWLRKNKKFTDTEFIETLKYLCDKIKELFDNMTDSECSVSIKVPIAGKVTSDTSVRNLCRNSEHIERRDTPNYKSINHTIIGNTAFINVLNKVVSKDKKGYFYYNNHISETRDYENTSRGAYPDRKLPYESEIVVPILPSHITASEKYNIVGFLCVDCNNVNKFDEKYDTILIEGIADGIYDIISRRKRKAN